MDSHSSHLSPKVLLVAKDNLMFLVTYLHQPTFAASWHLKAA
jgi:hypothetical protein